MAHSLNPPKWFLHHCYGHSEHLTLHYVTLVCVGLSVCTEISEALCTVPL